MGVRVRAPPHDFAAGIGNDRPMALPVPFPLRRPALLAATLAATLTTSCGGGSDLPMCGADPLFTVLPIDMSAMASAGALGGLNAPGHTVPNDHAGLYVNAMGVPIVVPGDMRVKRVRRTRYLVSPFRQGQADYAIYFDLCREVEGQLGHLTTLRSDLEARIATTGCETYSTADEMVESCVSSVNVELMAGEPLGTVGGATAMAFDFGTYDSRHENAYVNPSRVLHTTLEAVCPYELFPAPEAEFLLSHVGYGSSYRTVEPRCGTMEVDVAGTAQGVWVRADDVANQGGDESRFLTLGLDNIHPDTTQVLAMGPVELGATNFAVPIQATGRVNRRFSDLTNDGAIACYSAGGGQSHFVALGVDGHLRVERLTHAVGSSPCGADPSTWAFGVGVIEFIR